MSTERVKQESEVSIERRSPMEMISLAFDAAIKQGAALEVVDRILEQQKWMIRHSEEEQFNATLKRIQKQLKVIPKRGWNPDTKSWFATSGDIDREIQRLIDEEGMVLSFVPAVSDKPDEVLIIGTLALGAYHREYPLPMPADGKGPKGGGVMSRTHATGSAITYGIRYLKRMIFDLRFEEKDDDGNAAGMTQGEADDWLAKMEEGTTPTEVFAHWQKANAAASKAASGGPDWKAMTLLTQKRDARLTALKKRPA